MYFVTLISGPQQTPTTVSCFVASPLTLTHKLLLHIMGSPSPCLPYLSFLKSLYLSSTDFQLHELSYHVSVIPMMLQFCDQKQLLFFLLVSQAVYMCTCACTGLLSPEPSTLQKLWHVVTHKRSRYVLDLFT